MPPFQMSTISTGASARPRRSIDQSSASRPKNRSTAVLRASTSVSLFLSKELCPHFAARYSALGIALVFGHAGF